MAEGVPVVSVSGGAGGIGANLDDMRTESGALDSMTVALLEQATSAAGIAFDPDLAASAVLSPVTAAAAEQKIVFATGQLAVFATEAGVTAVFLEGAVVAYETADRALASLAAVEANTVTFVAGVYAVPLALAAGSLVVVDVASTFVAGYGAELIRSVGAGATKIILDPSRLLTDGGPLSALVIATADSFDAASAQSEVNTRLRSQLQQLNVIAGQNPWIVDLIAKGAPGLITGLSLSLVLAWGPQKYTALTGQQWPPLSYEKAVEAIIGAGNRFGMLQDGAPLTTADLFTPPAPLDSAVIRPKNVADLMAGSAQLDANDTLDGHADAFARIRIITIDGTPPRYIVQIPSTQSWAPDAGATPNDLTSDTAAMAGRQTALASAVEAAMKEARIPRTAPVMLEGFSLGGITAGAMAADRSLPFTITHVVTAGAPISNFDIPSKVQVLSLEHNEDPVARLDGRANPDRSNWTTVHADAPLLKSDHGVSPGIAGAHNADRYAETAAAASASGDASVDDWQRSASGFFAGDGTVVDYGAKRG